MMRYPYDSKALEEEIGEVTKYATFVTKEIIGYSVLGQPIYELTIGKGPASIHWNGSFHANEWMTSAVLMDVVRQYVKAINHDGVFGEVKARELFSQTRLSVVPMVNPDGVDLVMHGPPHGSDPSEFAKMNGINQTFTPWKGNIRGVDLNNQFPARWEWERARKPKQPSFRDYPGEQPLTEPEAQAMVMLTKKRDFDRVLAFHSQGEVVYWGYQGMEPVQSSKTVDAFYKKSGYLPVRTIESFAGYKDWFIQEYKREGYTVEIGRGINPLPLSSFPVHLEKVKEICAVSLAVPLE
ncbi:MULTISPECIES: M14 family metallopeptidase [Pontibacillus]|uniref:M14 family metallocarboxypeptidase n=1 Tax=Pontibacillus chungwhensis TaxID=265426 RepID=A0ABY8UU28_9BACI|nr:MULTISPECIES: M14 family metallocarboxypeptidase [Pontibacillus]MCD5323564.1 M14 family metallocarboxypeptidase [Pontibacillus sp. HN14]WIF96933.1 M14 family metallocarboxypeptidase [Pontibacillus chungwhensis]